MMKKYTVPSAGVGHDGRIAPDYSRPGSGYE